MPIAACWARYRAISGQRSASGCLRAAPDSGWLRDWEGGGWKVRQPVHADGAVSQCNASRQVGPAHKRLRWTRVLLKAKKPSQPTNPWFGILSGLAIKEPSRPGHYHLEISRLEKAALGNYSPELCSDRSYRLGGAVREDEASPSLTARPGEQKGECTEQSGSGRLLQSSL